MWQWTLGLDSPEWLHQLAAPLARALPSPLLGSILLPLAAFAAGALLIYAGYRRSDLGVGRSMALLGLFFLACGSLFAGDGLAMAMPGHWSVVLSRLLAAVVGFTAVGSLLLDLPRLRRLPAPAEFHRAHEALSREAVSRQIAQRRWRVSESRFEAAFRQSAVGMAITDHYGRVRRANPAMHRLLGWPPTSATDTALVDHCHEDDRPRLRATLGQLRLGTATDLRLELRLHDGAGDTFWALISLGRLDSGVVWQLQDIRERKAHEQALQEARDSLECEVAERTRELRAANERLRRLAQEDELTGLSNRRDLLSALQRLHATARRYDYPLAVIMIDVDHFKGINDERGHATGDRALAAVADVLRQSCRCSDVIGRYGGDEFCLILPHADAVAAMATAEKVRYLVRRLTLEDDRGRRVPLNCSLGVSILLPQEESPDPLMQRADEALYRAKGAGRDCAVLLTPPEAGAAVG